MDSEAKKALEEMGRGLGVNAEELGRIRREERRQRRRLAVASLVAGVASFFIGALVGGTVSKSYTIYPFAVALPLLGISRASSRANILRFALISGGAFILGYLMMLPNAMYFGRHTYYGVYGR